MIGKTLGHYEITDKLGKGGMGEVWRARDTKLGREVAIKTLTEEFAKDEERLARFEREAKLLASLNHPNIGEIYGLGESEGMRFLVLELVEGDTLEEFLAAGPPPIEFALVIACQIAETLEAAHETGIIHRDLKPANIKITPEGNVKVLDFGLAKAFAGRTSGDPPDSADPVQQFTTGQGIILGTVPYMSPEQARGKEVDRRSDIWAFGCVLFEMLTGRRVFGASTLADVLAEVIVAEPKWDSLPPALHPRIRLLLERCLEKDWNDRYHDAADLRVDIRMALSELRSGQWPPAEGTRERSRPSLMWVLVATALIVSVGLVLRSRTPPLSPALPSRYVAVLSNELDSTSAIALSPDGRRLVYASGGDLYMRVMDELEPTRIPGTEGARDPFFSPDGMSIGFFTSTLLKRVPVGGGGAVSVAEVPSGLRGTWNSEGWIYFGRIGPSDLFRVPATGGTVESFATLDDLEDVDYAEVLPGGGWVLFSAAALEWYAPRIMAQSLETGERKVVIEDGYFPRYVRTGHLVYASCGQLLAVAFDPGRAEVTGRPVTVVENVATSDLGWPALFAVADDGTLAFVHGASNRTLAWVGRDGQVQESLGAPPRPFDDPRLSPDGRRIALTVSDPDNRDVWVWDLNNGTLSRLTFDEGADAVPVWTPDGSRFAFFSDRDGGRDVFWKAADGTGTAERLASVPGRRLVPWSWSPDGKTLLLTELIRITGQDIGALLMDEDREWRPILNEEFVEATPELSPDGRWMAYLSNESGQMEVYVRPYPNVDASRWQVSLGGADDPLWSPDGRELFYRNGNALMTVAVEDGTPFSAGRPEVLFEAQGFHFSAQGRQFDVDLEGDRFIMIQESRLSGEGTRGQINIVLNWYQELLERVPVN